MKLVSRQPDFNRAFRTSRAFENAMATYRAAKHPRATPELVALPDESVDVSEMSVIPGGLSVREQSTRMLEAAGTRIVSEHEGRVQRMLLTVPKPWSPHAVDLREARHFETLIARLGPAVEYVVVGGGYQRTTVESWLTRAGVPLSQLTFIESPFDFTIWAQDAYVALADQSDNVVLCEGVAFLRGDDMTIADDIAAQSNIAAVPSYLYFQGGNVLGGEALTLLGYDYVARNIGRFGLRTVADVLARFEGIFGTPVLALGGEKSADQRWLRQGILSGRGLQPIFHIDMYVTPTGVMGEDGKEIVFLGRPRKAYEVTGRRSDVPWLNDLRYDEFFDETACQLAAKFDVRTLPLWLTYGTLQGVPGEARYYNLTWNNAIVENDGETRRVLLPSYSEDAEEYGVDGGVRRELEAAAEAAWKAIGFEVQFMDGLEDLAFAAGSIHCMTKTLRRTRR